LVERVFRLAHDALDLARHFFPERFRVCDVGLGDVADVLRVERRFIRFQELAVVVAPGGDDALGVRVVADPSGKVGASGVLEVHASIVRPR